MATCARLSCILSFWVHVNLFYRIVSYYRFTSFSSGQGNLFSVCQASVTPRRRRHVFSCQTASLIRCLVYWRQIENTYTTRSHCAVTAIGLINPREVYLPDTSLYCRAASVGGGRFRALIGGVSAGYGSDGGHQAVHSADRRETIRCGGLTSVQDHDVSWVSHADQPVHTCKLFRLAADYGNGRWNPQGPLMRHASQTAVYTYRPVVVVFNSIYVICKCSLEKVWNINQNKSYRKLTVLAVLCSKCC